MRLQSPAALSPDAAPLAEQQSVAEQVGPNFDTVEAPLVASRANADQRDRLGEERKLDRGGRSRGAYFAASGHVFDRSVSQADRFGVPDMGEAKRRIRRASTPASSMQVFDGPDRPAGFNWLKPKMTGRPACT
jgi:hypothetical protein